ncbi:MAG: DUF4830 domain-containing protein [Candidatus Heteroscillospira sp.]|jgi:hypothetical protein
MYFVTVKFNRRTAVAIIVAAALVLLALIFLFSGPDSQSAFRSAKLETREQRVEFLKELGWEAQPESETEKTVLIPREFTGVYQEYNRLQEEQGFDLREYIGTEVQVYSYIITNYKSSDTVVATLYTCKGRLIAGDIHSTTLSGFMHGLK